MRYFFPLLVFLFCLPALSSENKTYGGDSKFFLEFMEGKLHSEGVCSNMLGDLSLIERDAVRDAISDLVKDEVVTYLSGGDSYLKGIKDGKFKDGGFKFDVVFDKGLESSALALSPRERVVVQSYGNGEIKRKAKSSSGYIFSISKRYPVVKFYPLCEIFSVAVGQGEDKDFYKELLAYVKERPEKASVGYFAVSAGPCFATEKVGTGNPFAEPKQWEGSRFFIVNASFKNMDNEARVPLEGSLYINYKGGKYEFDSVESIPLEGYNVWLQKINPLIVMKTKIVYRIPDEIEGEVFWEPGRNRDGVRLWCGTVNAVN